MTFPKGLLGGLFLAAALVAGGWAGRAHALTPEQALAIAQGDSDSRIAALNERVAAGDTSVLPFVKALLDDEAKVAGGKVLLVQGETVVDAATGA